ncbi:MAG: site-2 protease family protein [Pseudomonadales bacterium]|nr:site-2 protease family protein [Pseudomonadales bacterium]MCP5185635.1 site-2 protease family protein [Pseudomonadales bacterium]
MATSNDSASDSRQGWAQISLGHLFGIRIGLHVSVLIIFALIVSSLGGGMFPQWHPDWSAAVRWSSAIIAAALFLASLLAHELSHAVTARRLGIGIRGITLFLFGGVAEMESEARTPRDEFLVAAAGPLASFVLAIVFSFLTGVLEPGFEPSGAPADFATLGVAATITLWLSMVNFVLAVFNLIPGFPLDGGRLFRALLWWKTGDVVQATRQAAAVGRFAGWVMIFWGVWRAVHGDTVNGLWLVFIGWFLQRLAVMSAAQILMERSLKGLSIDAIMRTHFEHVPTELPLNTFIDDFLLRSSQLVWPVTRDGQDVGVMTLERLHNVVPTDRAHTTVADAMQPIAEVVTLPAGTPAQEALHRLAEHATPMPVIRDGRVVGLIHQADVLKWLALHHGPAETV